MRTSNDDNPRCLGMTDIERDAARYRWIRAQTNFELWTGSRQGVPWTQTETGQRYFPWGNLAVNGTGFGGIESLDDMIDQAMELYPS